MAELEQELADYLYDILALIEINNFGKADLLEKMKRLCKEHNKEFHRILEGGKKEDGK